MSRGRADVHTHQVAVNQLFVAVRVDDVNGKTAGVVSPTGP